MAAGILRHGKGRDSLLRNLAKDDISPDGRGMPVPELKQAMSSYLRPEDDLKVESEVLLERDWLSLDGEGRLCVAIAPTPTPIGLVTAAARHRLECSQAE